MNQVSQLETKNEEWWSLFLSLDWIKNQSRINQESSLTSEWRNEGKNNIKVYFSKGVKKKENISNFVIITLFSVWHLKTSQFKAWTKAIYPDQYSSFYSSSRKGFLYLFPFYLHTSLHLEWQLIFFPE